ncbi:MAG: hypothetical protein AAF989_11995 [Planctomycetota bacterium]
MNGLRNAIHRWPSIALVFLTTIATHPLSVSGQSTTPPMESNPQPEITGPLVVQGLPGTSTTRLVPMADYISPLASIFGNYSFGRSSSQTPTQPSDDSQLARYYRSGGRSNLLRLPEMFGDFRSAGPGLTLIAGGESVLTEMPLAAGVGGLRIAEDNQALPANRIWFGFNHFHNAFDAQPLPSLTPTQRQSANRFVAATEFLLDEGRTSLELRMAFGSAVNLTGATPTAGFNLDVDSIGNLSLILKRLLYADACTAWSAGLGVETPTGSDAVLQQGTQQFQLQNDAVHLIPFMAYSERFGRIFTHAFTQIDVATGGNELTVSAPGAGSFTLGRIDPQPLLGVDIGFGYWLVEPCCGRSNGLAAVTELHYTAGLGDQDVFTLVSGAGTTVGANTPRGTATDLLNVTTGLEYSTGSGWALRTAVAAPLQNERVFDTEIIVQANRTF